MLRPAHIGHLALLRSLIRDAARDGAFDPALAWDSPAATRFFAELRQALKTGYFVVEDTTSRSVRTVAVPGYVYWADETAGSEPPVGFGLFRAVDDGYELWLTGLDAPLRGKGHGRGAGRATHPHLFGPASGRRREQGVEHRASVAASAQVGLEAGQPEFVAVVDCPEQTEAHRGFAARGLVRPVDVARNRDGPYRACRGVLDDEITGLQRLPEFREEARGGRRIPGERRVERAVAGGVADQRTQHREVADVGGSEHGGMARGA